MHTLAVFFDTEFTNFENPELISLGAVTIDGQEFYAEVTPLPEGRSDFVNERVVPQLCGPAYPKEELAIQFRKWLGGFQRQIELCADSQYDQEMLRSLFGRLPFFVGEAGGNRCFWCPLPGGVHNQPHHALKDAKLLRDAFAQHFQNQRIQLDTVAKVQHPTK